MSENEIIEFHLVKTVKYRRYGTGGTFKNYFLFIVTKYKIDGMAIYYTYFPKEDIPNEDYANEN